MNQDNEIKSLVLGLEAFQTMPSLTAQEFSDYQLLCATLWNYRYTRSYFREVPLDIQTALTLQMKFNTIPLHCVEFLPD